MSILEDHDAQEEAITYYDRLVEEFGDHTFPVNEQFGRTIQGEGPYAGRAVQFIRFGGCNLSCSWCDAKFTWDASQYDLRLENPPKTVRDIVQDTMPGTTMIISGGEPLLHQNNKAWEAMLVGFASRGCEVHIETNGTIAPNTKTQMWVSYASVSPKLPHAGKHKRSQSPSVDPEWAKIIKGKGSSIAKTSTLKYVVEDVDDVDAAIAWAKDLDWPLNRLWVMPEGTSTETLQERWPSIARKAADENINATHRVHVLAFGDTRGT